MIIRRDGEQLMQAGTLQIKDSDTYSLTVDCFGLNQRTSDVITYTLVLSRNEIAFLTRAERTHH